MCVRGGRALPAADAALVRHPPATLPDPTEQAEQLQAFTNAVESGREAAKGRDSAIGEVTKGVSQLRKAAEERDATVAAVSKDIAELRKETSAEVSSMRAGIVKLVSEA